MSVWATIMDQTTAAIFEAYEKLDEHEQATIDRHMKTLKKMAHANNPTLQFGRQSLLEIIGKIGIYLEKMDYPKEV
jgi:hypothetical protein